MKDGKYTIEVSLAGGSGKASIQSPAEIEMKNGTMTAEIVWNSSNYSYMEIGDKRYLPQKDEKNSTFLIEVPSLDTDIEFVAETIAMSKPRQIEYTLHFDSQTLNKSTDFPIYGAIIGAVGVITLLSVIIIRKRKKKNETNK